jgi:hypothetical protein
MAQSIGVFIPILGILLGMIAVVGGLIVKSQKLKLEMMRTQGANSAVQDETMRELQKLKDRVAVLERLLTDDDRKLAGEIERLRRDEMRG